MSWFPDPGRHAASSLSAEAIAELVRKEVHAEVDRALQTIEETQARWMEEVRELFRSAGGARTETNAVRENAIGEYY